MTKTIKSIKVDLVGTPIGAVIEVKGNIIREVVQ